MILSIVNQKGGVGKTTLSVNIATALAFACSPKMNPSKHVVLVDADPQRSALNWSDNRTKHVFFAVTGMPKKTLHRDVVSLAAHYNYVVIDGPPQADEITLSALYAADFVLIPVQPSPYDVWSAKEIVVMLEKVQILKPNLKAAFVINRKIVNTAIGRDVTEALKAYAPIPVLKAAIHQRVAFAESAGAGKTVMETDGEGIAAQEVYAVIREFMEVYNAQESAIREPDLEHLSSGLTSPAK